MVSVTSTRSPTRWSTWSATSGPTATLPPPSPTALRCSASWRPSSSPPRTSRAGRPSAPQSADSRSHPARDQENLMPRPVTLFTGQFADLPFEEVCRMAADWGYDGREIACWGDHFEVDKAVGADDYVAAWREILDRHGLSVF